MVTRGHLAGFIIADPRWRIDDVEAILSKLPEPIPQPLLEDDENFIIEKE